MMNLPHHDQIERAYDRHLTYGTATAYGYMQGAGDLDCFPASMSHTVTSQCAGKAQNTLPSEAPESCRSSRASDIDVVIIDDDPVLQDVVNAVLEDQDISMEACPLGWKAHNCIRKTHPRVIILDVAMPDVDGIRLFYLLRADPRTRDIPVIFLTASPEKVHYELPNFQEMDAVLLPKPFDVEQLIEAVTSALAVPGSG